MILKPTEVNHKIKQRKLKKKSNHDTSKILVDLPGFALVSFVDILLVDEIFPEACHFLPVFIAVVLVKLDCIIHLFANYES
jgi:hypothetical protein